MLGVSRQSLAAAREKLDDLTTRDDVDFSTLGDELFQVLHLLDRQTALRRALSDPAATPARKADLARSLLGNRVGESTLAVLDTVVRGHWSRALDLADAVEAIAVASEATSAEKEGRLDDLEDELFRFGRIALANSRLRSVLSDPAVPGEGKEALLDELLEGKVTSATLRLVTEVVVHPRSRGLERGLEEYARMTAERRRRLTAVVRSAVPLSEEQTRRLADALAAAYGRELHLNIEVDPDVMGGLTVQIGDEVIDGTIAGRMAEVRRRLSE